MKKKNLVVKGMAMLMACAMVVGNNGMVAHAYIADDGTEHSDNAPGGNSGTSVDIGGGSSDSGSSSDSGNSGSSSSGGSSDSGSSYSGGSSSNSGSSDSGNYSYDSGSGNSGSASYSAPAPKAAGGTASAGKETFRALAKSGSGTYKVTHKGVEIATFTLMDTESKKAVPCTAVALKQREDNKWAIDFQVTEKYAETTQAADITGLTIGAPLDRTYMYKTLGVSYITINDEIIIDIESEAAATTK